MSEKSDLNRRHFLTVATSVTGAVGVGFVAVPFVASWLPSARARALGAPIEVDISKLDDGSMVRVQWRGRPVWVVRRTQAMLDRMVNSGTQLEDPDSLESIQPDFAVNDFRSLKPEILVVLGVCTHLGCSPIGRFDVAPSDLGSDWVGGFFCPCHGSKFDLSGRVFPSMPAPTNLTIPPYRFVGDNLIIIGEDIGVAA